MRHPLMGLLAVVLTAGCSSTRVNSDFNESADFSSYRTWAFMSETPLLIAEAASVNPLVQGRVMNATRAALTAKGYAFVENRQRADFVVSFTLGARDKIRVTSYPTAYRSPGRWGWGAAYHSDVDVRKYVEGTLAIDVFDVKQKRPVWHGWAVRTISAADRRNPAPVINETVAAILDEFPPG